MNDHSLSSGNEELVADMEDFWVFGYGSLMWRPGFEFVESQIAVTHGFRRALCIRSWVHRGTRENPGLVLGLDRGGSCKGLAFRVSPEKRDDVLAYLRARELVTNVYLERTVPLKLADGRRVRGVTYVADTAHEQFQRTSSPEDAAAVVSRAHGESGDNVEYVKNTVEHLRHLGIYDHCLEGILRHIQPAEGVR